MARFKCQIRRFCAAGFEFNDGELYIDDADTEKLALWRKVWAGLSLKYRGKITEVTEFDSEHQQIAPKVLRGITGSTLTGVDPGSTEQKPGSMPDQVTQPQRQPLKPNSIPTPGTKPEKVVGTFDHDGDGKAGGSLPASAKPQVKVNI